MTIDFDKIEKVGEYKNDSLNWFEGRDINAVYVLRFGDDYYIGSSVYVFDRIRQHIAHLVKGDHHSDKMQDKFNSNSDFEIYILERGIENNKLLSTEGRYIKQYNPNLNKLLNNQERLKKKGLRLRLKEIMSEKGISSVLLSEKAEISKVSVSNIINNKTMPSVETLEKLAKILEVSFIDLFEETREVEQEPTPTITCPHCGKSIELEVKKE